MTVIEDHPLQNVVKLVEDIGDTVEALLGSIRELCEAAQKTQSAVEYPMDSEAARRSLAACHTNFQKVTERYFSELASYEIVDEIITLGRARRGEWQVWATLVKDTINKGQQALLATNHTLFECWQALSESVVRQAISVQTTSVGLHIKRP